MPTYNLKKEMNSGGGTFIFNGFRLRPFTNLVYTDEEMLKTIKFLKAKNIDNNQLKIVLENSELCRMENLMEQSQNKSS